MSRLRSVSIRHVWIGLTVGAAFIGPASAPIGLPDLYWTLLAGAWMVANGRLLEGDPFTAAPHSAGPVLNVQWLADLIFHGFEALGGLPMVITGTALVVSVTYALLLVAGLSASGHLRLSCVAVWLAYVLGASNLSPRPQTLAYPIFALFLLAVMRSEWRKDTRALWLLPPATALWANLHGSFFTGFVLLGCAIAARVLSSRSLYAARPFVLTLVGCLLASLINPYGPGLLVYVAILVLPWFKTSISILPRDERGVFSPDTPVAVGEYLRTHEPPSSGMLLNDQTWGGYLEWAAWPKHQVFVDGRFEVHPPQVWFDYLDIVFPSARWRT